MKISKLDKLLIDSEPKNEMQILPYYPNNDHLLKSHPDDLMKTVMHHIKNKNYTGGQMAHHFINNMDMHGGAFWKDFLGVLNDILPAASFVSSFIPVVGAPLSTGLNLLNKATTYGEKNYDKFERGYRVIKGIKKEIDKVNPVIRPAPPIQKHPFPIMQPQEPLEPPRPVIRPERNAPVKQEGTGRKITHKLIKSIHPSELREMAEMYGNGMINDSQLSGGKVKDFFKKALKYGSMTLPVILTAYGLYKDATEIQPSKDRIDPFEREYMRESRLKDFSNKHNVSPLEQQALFKRVVLPKQPQSVVRNLPLLKENSYSEPLTKEDVYSETKENIINKLLHPSGTGRITHKILKNASDSEIKHLLQMYGSGRITSKQLGGSKVKDFFKKALKYGSLAVPIGLTAYGLYKDFQRPTGRLTQQQIHDADIYNPSDSDGENNPVYPPYPDEQKYPEPSVLDKNEEEAYRHLPKGSYVAFGRNPKQTKKVRF